MFRITRDCASLHVGTGPQELEARSPRDTCSPVLTALLPRAKHGSNHGALMITRISTRPHTWWDSTRPQKEKTNWPML